MEIGTLELPLPDPDLRVDHITQPDRQVVNMLVANYYGALVPAQDETHPKHEESVGMVEVQQLVLSMLELLPQMEHHDKYNSSMPVREITEEDVAALLKLREELALHINRHGDKRTIAQLTEITLFLTKINQA